MPDFDDIDLDLLREFSSPSEAAESVRAQIRSVENPELENSKLWHEQIQAALDHAMALFVDANRVEDDFSLKLDADIKVVLGSNGGNCVCIRVAQGYLVVIDRTYFISLLLYLFFAARERDYARHLSSWCFLHHCLAADRPFPLGSLLLTIAAQIQAGFLSFVTEELAKFIVYHEIGHVYQEKEGSGYLDMTKLTPELEDALRMKIDAVIAEKSDFGDEAVGVELTKFVGEFRAFHSSWSIFQTWRDPADSVWKLLLPEKDVKEFPEYASDVFAVFTMLAVDGVDLERSLESLSTRMSIWSLMKLAMDYQMRIMGQVFGNLQAPTSHPAASSRLDVIIFHLRKLAASKGLTPDSIDWDSFGSYYTTIWSKPNDDRIKDILHLCTMIDEETNVPQLPFPLQEEFSDNSSLLATGYLKVFGSAALIWDRSEFKGSREPDDIEKLEDEFDAGVVDVASQTPSALFAPSITLSQVISEIDFCIK